MNNFSEIRRQPFISREYFLSIKEMAGSWAEEIQHHLDDHHFDVEAHSLESATHVDLMFNLMCLKYTAGDPIVQLRVELEQVVFAYEQYGLFARALEENLQYPLFAFQEIGEFERVVQLVGLAYLLHRRDLIPRIHSLIAGSAYDGVDAMYEELISHVIPDRPYLENWYHQQPYVHLLNATDLPEPEQKAAELAAYCKAWYPAMKSAPWHDSHLRIKADDGDYFGYWAFEAGAIAYLYGIDDSAIDHLVYPKDMVAFAREFAPEASSDASDEALRRLRCQAGNPCPKEGWWWTPAAMGKNGGRRYFKEGESMPKFDFGFGDTIWQWDEKQQA